MQGSQLAGEGGAGVEMAPLTLLEGVTNFLIQSRAGLRHEAKTVLAERISSTVPGKSHRTMSLCLLYLAQKCCPVHSKAQDFEAGLCH